MYKIIWTSHFKKIPRRHPSPDNQTFNLHSPNHTLTPRAHPSLNEPRIHTSSASKILQTKPPSASQPLLAFPLLRPFLRVYGHTTYQHWFPTLKTITSDSSPAGLRQTSNSNQDPASKNLHILQTQNTTYTRTLLQHPCLLFSYFLLSRHFCYFAASTAFPHQSTIFPRTSLSTHIRLSKINRTINSCVAAQWHIPRTIEPVSSNSMPVCSSSGPRTQGGCRFG